MFGSRDTTHDTNVEDDGDITTEARPEPARRHNHVTAYDDSEARSNWR
jgi:hypothetical protein